MKQKITGIFGVIAVLSLFSSIFLSSRPIVTQILLILIMILSLMSMINIKKKQ